MRGRVWVNFEDFADGDDAVGDRIRAQVSALVPEDAMDEIVLQLQESVRGLAEYAQPRISRMDA
jgi:hypothetical protein